MTAVALEPLYVQPTPVKPSRTVLARRRVAAALLFIVALAVVAMAVSSVVSTLGDVPASVSERRTPSPAAPRWHVVEQGDTLWSIARGLQPEGDVRRLVDALRDANGGTVLHVGTRLALP